VEIDLIDKDPLEILLKLKLAKQDFINSSSSNMIA
jgi:hypothetical protein